MYYIYEFIVLTMLHVSESLSVREIQKIKVSIKRLEDCHSETEVFNQW